MDSNVLLDNLKKYVLMLSTFFELLDIVGLISTKFCIVITVKQKNVVMKGTHGMDSDNSNT